MTSNTKETVKGLLLIGAVIVGIFFGVRHLVGNDGHVIIDPRLRTYVDDYIRDMEEAGIDVEDDLDDLVEIRFGACPSIVFNKDGFDVANDILGTTSIDRTSIVLSEEALNKGAFPPARIRSILYHELGHALFELDHTDGIMQEASYVDDQSADDPVLLKEYTDQCQAAQ